MKDIEGGGRLSRILKQEEWKTILAHEFGGYTEGARDFLARLKANGNKPLPLVPLGDIERRVIYRALKNDGFGLVQAPKDPHRKGPQLATYSLERVKKEP